MQTGIEALTEKLYLPKFADNVYNTHPTLQKLNAVKKSYDGGSSIVVPVEYQELVSGGSFTGLGYLDTAVNDLGTQARDWARSLATKINVSLKVGEPFNMGIPSEASKEERVESRQATPFLGMKVYSRPQTA